MPRPKVTVDIFNDRLLETETGCWEYQWSKDQNGYGKVGNERAHRFAWIATNGPIPKGMLVRHTCDNPPCCNPSHLLLGTVAQNNADRALRKRSAPVHGAHNGMAALTDEQVKQILHRIALGEVQADIARDYRVGESTISRIKYGQRSLTGGINA